MNYLQLDDIKTPFGTFAIVSSDAAFSIKSLSIIGIHDLAMQLANELLQQQPACSLLAATIFVFPSFPNSKLKVPVENSLAGDAIPQISAISLKTRIFGLPYGENRMIIGSYLLKLYHRTYRWTISRADA